MCPAAAEVKDLTSRPAVLLRTVDPCDRPLDPAYLWAAVREPLAVAGPSSAGQELEAVRAQTNEVSSRSAGRFMLLRSCKQPSAVWEG